MHGLVVDKLYVTDLKIKIVLTAPENDILTADEINMPVVIIVHPDKLKWLFYIDVQRIEIFCYIRQSLSYVPAKEPAYLTVARSGLVRAVVFLVFITGFLPS